MTIAGSGYYGNLAMNCASPAKTCTTDADCDQVPNGRGYCYQTCHYLKCPVGSVWDESTHSCTCSSLLPQYLQAIRNCSDQAALASGKPSPAHVYNLQVSCPLLGYAYPTLQCVRDAIPLADAGNLASLIVGTLVNSFCSIDNALKRWGCPNTYQKVPCSEVFNIDMSCGAIPIDIGNAMVSSSTAAAIGSCPLYTASTSSLTSVNAMIPAFLNPTGVGKYEAQYTDVLCQKKTLLFRNVLPANCSVACDPTKPTSAFVNWLPKTTGSVWQESTLPSDVILSCQQTSQLDDLLSTTLHYTDCLGDPVPIVPFNSRTNDPNCASQFSIVQTWTMPDTSCSGTLGDTIHSRQIHVQETEPKLGPSNVVVCVWPPRNKIVGIVGLNSTLTALIDPSTECSGNSRVMVPNGFCQDVTPSTNPDAPKSTMGPCFVDAGVVYVLAAKSATGEARHYQIKALIVSPCGNEYELLFEVVVPHSESTDATSACTSLVRDDTLTMYPSIDLIDLNLEMAQEVRDNVDATVKTFEYGFAMSSVDSELVDEFAMNNRLARFQQEEERTITDERVEPLENAVSIANIINAAKQNLKCSAPSSSMISTASILLAAVIASLLL